MFKKIRSDRDPRDTVISELGKEFKPYVDQSSQTLRRLAKNYPRFLFCIMIINIVLSCILCFTVFRHKEPPLPIKPIAPKFDNIISLSSALRKTIRLKQQVDSLSQKKKLSSADSAILIKDLDSLNHFKLKP